MDDEELIKEFIRAERSGNGVEITVCEIEWPTPSEPVSHWTVVTQLPLDPSEAQIDTAVRSVLDGHGRRGRAGTDHVSRSSGHDRDRPTARLLPGGAGVHPHSHIGATEVGPRGAPARDRPSPGSGRAICAEARQGNRRRHRHGHWNRRRRSGEYR